MSFQEFADKVAKHPPLFAVECSPYHWQIKGGFSIVNYFHTTRKIYIQGATEAYREGGVADVIRVAKGHSMKSQELERESKAISAKRRRRWKRYMIAKDPRCCWCGILMTYETATFEHILPLSKGGSNRLDNLTLACRPCNERRGNIVRTLPIDRRPGTQ